MRVVPAAKSTRMLAFGNVMFGQFPRNTFALSMMM